MISLEHVSKSYAAGIPALNDVNIEIEQGEFVFIVGDSGSGKSTLIRLLLKELKPTEGNITINGYKLNKMKRRQIPKFRRNIGVVFQDFRLLDDRNVYENVAFAQRVIGESTRNIKKNVPAILSMVGLAAKYRSFPKELSGGEQQRVAIARALINRPKILLADEPTGNLDNNNAWEIMKLLEEINEKGTTVIVVTHNVEIVKAMKKRVITMKQGVVIGDEKNENMESLDELENSMNVEEFANSVDSMNTEGFMKSERFRKTKNFRKDFMEESMDVDTMNWDVLLEDEKGGGSDED